MPFPPKPKKIRTVYLDHAATTPLDPAVFRAMKPWLEKNYANPSALYGAAVTAREAIESARKKVAEVLFTQSDTIVFTGSGTESTNLAILGLAISRVSNKQSKQRHIITTAIEHHAVMHPIQQLEKDGWQVTYLPVDRLGHVSIEDVRKALRPETVLVSIMYANNEIGTIQPIADIGREILKWRKAQNTPYPYFHTDACQAASYLDLQVDRLHVDLMSLNGSKIYGPKGTGMLYKRRGVELEPIMYGGGQEFGLHSGTENVAGIVGLTRALELVQKDPKKECKRIVAVRDYFWKRIQKEIPDVTLNGQSINDSSPRHRSPAWSRPRRDRGGGGEVRFRKFALTLSMNSPYVPPTRVESEFRLPNNLNVTFKNVDAEALILYLDEYGIQCSSGSACTTDSDEVSHVLLACGLSKEEAKSSIRFTLGKKTTKKDIDSMMKYLPKIVEAVRHVCLTK